MEFIWDGERREENVKIAHMDIGGGWGVRRVVFSDDTSDDFVKKNGEVEIKIRT